MQIKLETAHKARENKMRALDNQYKELIHGEISPNKKRQSSFSAYKHPPAGGDTGKAVGMIEKEREALLKMKHK